MKMLLSKLKCKRVKVDQDLLRSIRAIGLIVPLTIDENNKVIDGKNRFACLKALGITEAKVYISTGTEPIGTALSAVELGKIVTVLLEKGLSYQEIARECNRTVTTLKEWVRRYECK